MDGTDAHVEMSASAGESLQFHAAGVVPFAATAPMEIRVNGAADLKLANAWFEAGGRRVLGRVSVDGTVVGPRASPALRGVLEVNNGDLQDFVLGLHLGDISGTLQADGKTLHVSKLMARAGAGTVSIGGTVMVDEPGLRVDLTLTGRDARILASDLITANTDLDLTLRGRSAERVELGGRVHVRRADITIPNSFPPNVVVLDVRRPGRAVPPAPRAYASGIGLSVAVDATSAVFVRGRGLDAELAGELHVAGTVAEPVVTGGFDLRNGTFNLGGAPLRFTSGRLGFNASNLRKAFDPTLDFVATTVSAGVTASVTIGGYADAPTFALTSTPELPPDKILARIVFGQSVTQLSALQIGQIGVALAAISGVGGAGLNPLATVQRALGLDRLSISSSSSSASGATSTATSVEAGRYLSN